MALTQFFTFPTSVLTAGQTYGPQTTPQVGGVFQNYQVSVQRMGTWPVGDCISVTIEYSQDNGQTWRTTSSVILGGGTLKDLSGVVQTISTINTGMGVVYTDGANPVANALAAADLFRVTVHCIQACSAIIKMGAF